MQPPITLHRDVGDRVFDPVQAGGTVCFTTGSTVERCLDGQWLPPLRDVFAGQLPKDDFLRTLTLSEDGALLVACSEGADGGSTLVAVVRVATGQTEHVVSVEASGVYVSAWISAQHGVLAVFGNDAVLWWDLDAWTDAPAARTPITDCGEHHWLHPDGRTLISDGIHGLVACDLITRRAWGLAPGLRHIRNLGFTDHGQMLLVIAEGTSTVRRLSLETGEWAGETVLERPAPYLTYIDAAFSPDGALLVGTDAGETVVWSTDSGARTAQWPAPPTEDEDTEPVYVFSSTHLLSSGMTLTRYAFPGQPIAPAAHPACFAARRILTPNQPLRQPLAPAVVEQIARLGGVLPGSGTLGDCLDVRWPDGALFAGTVGDSDLWMVRLGALGSLSEAWRMAPLIPLQIIAEMDGGNYYLVIKAAGAAAQEGDPLVYLLDHEQSDAISPGWPIGRLSVVLAALEWE